MKKAFSNRTVPAIIMAIAGIILIVITALNYIFGWKMGLPPAAIGIVFLAVGMAWIRRSNYKQQ